MSMGIGSKAIAMSYLPKAEKGVTALSDLLNLSFLVFHFFVGSVNLLSLFRGMKEATSVCFNNRWDAALFGTLQVLQRTNILGH